MTAIPLGQGLEITEDKLRVAPGTLQDCLNYEVAYHAGYRRIDGFLRFDGRPEGEDLAAYRSLVQPVPSGPAYGIHFFADRARGTSSLYGVVEAQRVEIETREIDAALLGSPGQRAEIHLGGQQTGLPNAWILEPNASFAGETRDLMEVLTIGPAPIGLIKAYTRVEVRDAQNIPNPQQRILDGLPPEQITDGTWLATVRGVEVISGEPVNGNVRMVMWVEVDTQSFVPVDTPLVLDGTADSVGFAVSVTGYSSNGSQAGSVVTVATDLDPSVNKGVLVRSTDQGWEPIPQSYEVNFRTGTNEPGTVYLGGLQVSPSETPAPLPGKPPQSASINLGGKDWSLSGSALVAALQADDGNFVTSTFDTTGLTRQLNLSNFGIEIDGLDEVTGFVVEVIAEKDDPLNSPIVVDSITASTGGARGAGVEIDGKDTFSFGSPTDLWGAASTEALKSALQSSGFTIRLRFRCDDDTTLPTALNLYVVRVVVYLREGSLASRVYIRSGAVDQEARVLFVSQTGGTWDGNNAVGTMTFARIANPALVASNAQVRTAPSGGGSLIAVLDGNLTPVRLPSRAKMEQRQSRFQFMTSNYFAAGRLAAVYGVSGAGPAFTFNNQYFFNIRTGRTEDEPRHVARHADLLALGYENGDADFSVPGRPDLFDGVLGAFSIGFGQRITGMLSLAGEAMGVWTENSTHIVKGSTSDQVVQQVIAPTTGAIEYTVADMGIPVFCDFRGINTLQASQQYGDFDLGRLSKGIRAWLLPRLQSQAQRPIMAEAVRKKNQYRLWFADGKILTMTWLEDRVPRFTFARWSLGEEGLVILTATSGVDVDSEAVGFATFNGNPYVYRTDHTDTFDGEPINASFTLNPMHVNGPGRYQRINVGHIHGIATGEFEIQTQIGVNYAIPGGHISRCVMQASNRPAFTKFRHKARGRDFAIKVETQGAPEHTLQVLEFPDISIRKMEL